MTDPAVRARRPDEDAVVAAGRVLDRLCTALALFGGLVLLAIIVVSTVSIVGRSLVPLLAGLVGIAQPPRSIPGDTEIVEMGTAVAVFAFLPLCHLQRGNVFVDFFTARAPLRVRSLLDALANLLFAVLAGALAWQMIEGLRDKIAYADTTMVLRLPVAWPFACATAAVWLLFLVTLYASWRSLAEVARGRPIGPRAAGAH